MIRLASAFILIAFSLAANAELLSKQSRTDLIERAKADFWGVAVLSNGEKVQPSSDTERKSLIISEELANFVAEKGAISGAGDWCGLDWQSHYFAVTAVARKSGLSEKQVAFVGFLHGVAYGNFLSSLRKNVPPCDAQQKENIKNLLDSSKASLKTEGV